MSRVFVSYRNYKIEQRVESIQFAFIDAADVGGVIPPEASLLGVRNGKLPLCIVTQAGYVEAIYYNSDDPTQHQYVAQLKRRGAVVITKALAAWMWSRLTQGVVGDKNFYNGLQALRSSAGRADVTDSHGIGNIYTLSTSGDNQDALMMADNITGWTIPVSLIDDECRFSYGDDLNDDLVAAIETDHGPIPEVGILTAINNKLSKLAELFSSFTSSFFEYFKDFKMDLVCNDPISGSHWQNHDLDWKIKLKALLPNTETQEQQIDPLPLLIRVLDAIVRPYAKTQQFRAIYSLDTNVFYNAPIREIPIRVFTTAGLTTYRSQTDAVAYVPGGYINASNARQQNFGYVGNTHEWDLAPAPEFAHTYESSTIPAFWATIQPQHSDVWAQFIQWVYSMSTTKYRILDIATSEEASSTDYSAILSEINEKIPTGLSSILNALAKTSDVQTIAGNIVNSITNEITTLDVVSPSEATDLKNQIVEALETIVIDPTTLEPPRWLVERLGVIEAISIWAVLPTLKNGAGKANRALLKWLRQYTTRSKAEEDLVKLLPADNKKAFTSVNKE